MATKKGSLSINSENIFPIIKKWLYSDHDIFLREMVSNGCDAITKLKKLGLMGEYAIPDDAEFKIEVQVRPKDKTITITDNGLGMTDGEVEEYINQIAFSGAQDFLEKYKDKANEDQIIGHFGLGFYSAFMVSDKVCIDTLSYREGAQAVHWESAGGTEFEMGEGSRTQVGTTITLYLNEDSVEFSNEYRIKEVLQKYCAFMPIPIYLENPENGPQYETIEKDDLKEKDKIVETIIEEPKTEEKENDKGEKEIVEISPRKEKYKILKRPVAINDIHPLWAKHPNECTDEDYRAFYRKVFLDYKEPLFWIHLNMDYPFNLKGILYFPKINTEYDSIEGTIKLYNNQVFIADNIKEVIPEFLMLLKGTIDCPDLPLNVSRSALQNDGFVKKISDYITKKVADKLTGMCKTDRANYEKYWDDISPFIKYGCLKDEKFADKIKDFILYRDLDDKYFTLDEFLEKDGKGEAGAGAEGDAEGTKEGEAGEAKTEDGAAGDGGEAKAEGGEAAEDGAADAKAGDGATGAEGDGESAKGDGDAADGDAGDGDSDGDDSDDDDFGDADDAEAKAKERRVFYVTNEKEQGQYIRMFREEGLDAVYLTHNIDSPFISFMEQKREGVRFLRIDADVNEVFKEEVGDGADGADADGFKADAEKLSDTFKKALGDDKLEVKVERLKNTALASMITLSEESRRMQDMMKMYNMGHMDASLFGGMGETLVLNANHPLVKYVLEHGEGSTTEKICRQLYDLAQISHGGLSAERMAAFVERSNEILLETV
ncbi:MAG: molecular chaperone HtpG [Lachnospiraceae bacterium]|jgi:molecular chaperone HtpG|nr:molecular chaperone HtpG [Lachnospiraceae bacterium]